MEISNKDRTLMKELMFGREDVQRFTQDSPVLPDVWLSYYGEPEKAHDLLLSPDWSSRPGEVAVALRNRLAADQKSHEHSISYNLSTVAASLHFRELIRGVLPLTSWWRENVVSEIPARKRKQGKKSKGKPLDVAALKDRIDEVAEQLSNPEADTDLQTTPTVLWLIRVVGAIAWRIENPKKKLPNVPASKTKWKPLVEALAHLLDEMPAVDRDQLNLVYRITLNRDARVSVNDSTVAVKADAARLLFNARCDRMAWAIVDSGIDATHPAFALRNGTDRVRNGTIATRVKATYDFTEIRDLLDVSKHKAMAKRVKARLTDDSALDRLTEHLEAGREIDWSLVEPLINIPHTRKGYVPPDHDHGTHVAGILGADWREAGGKDEPEELLMAGICPDIRLYDFRVLDRRSAGDEFAVIAALQFIRYLNQRHDTMVIHGVNISLSIRHDVANYACGRTPVCDECDRLTGAGIVVVAAAGNQGYEIVETSKGPREGYHNISITDPGNTESVITVGATHRNRPHTYGVSYFSSRGPTGDGRLKPDLVAPGEKIIGPVPGGDDRSKDGTSMAAPHVSGAAALLMARHPELIGQPGRIKKILMNTATDLGRERYFQGAGMLDILRALQSV